MAAVARTAVLGPGFLNRLTGMAFKITIKDGEKGVQDSNIGGG